MNFVFRADASSSIGTGHVARCLTLAHELRRRGASVSFVCAQLPGDLCATIVEQGFEVARLPGSQAVATAGARADADWTRASLVARGIEPHWTVVDHYDLDASWERTLRGISRRIFAIDDLANRDHDCDLLLDQNLVADVTGRYVGRVPPQSAMLLGPEWALLQPIYSQLHAAARTRQGAIRRVLLFFSGADARELTAQTLAVLTRMLPPEVAVDVVVGAGQRDSIAAQVAGHTNLRVHSALPSLAPLMLEADLAIGASGTTSWERLCLGLPAVVFTLADNQRPIAEELHSRGLVQWLGDANAFDAEKFGRGLGAVLAAPLDPEWSRRCSAVGDGAGTARVAAILCATPDTRLRARRANPADEARLLAWANDPQTRRNAFSTARIEAATHHAWFRARLSEVEDCIFLIVETAAEALALAQVRFQRGNGVWEVHFSLMAAMRGRGLGRASLAVALEHLYSVVGSVAVVGQVKAANTASCRIFESLAFAAKEQAAGETRVYRLELAGGGETEDGDDVR